VRLFPAMHKILSSTPASSSPTRNQTSSRNSGHKVHKENFVSFVPLWCKKFCFFCTDLTLKSLSRFSFLLLLILIACASKTTEPLQNPERFAEVYAKILLAGGDLNLLQREDKKTKLARADSVLKSLALDRQQFEAAVKYFSADPEQWQKVYTHVVAILEKQNSAADTTKH